MSDFFRLQKHIDELSAIGARDGAVTRLGLSAEEQSARDLVGSWCAARGAVLRRDAAANLFARFPGERENDPIVLVGSHVDSVPEGGRFDGALGVICAVEAIESLLDVGTRFQRPVEVVAWADEEGARFGIGLFGSAAAFGRLPARAAERTDRSGISIVEALRALGEQGDPALAARDPREIAAYLELHIEQGPRLAEANRPLGVVSDIVGIVHGRVTVKGRADHAGATVMTARADALLGAAEMALALETAARSREEHGRHGGGDRRASRCEERRAGRMHFLDRRARAGSGADRRCHGGSQRGRETRPPKRGVSRRRSTCSMLYRRHRST
jgi:allantoate deiminase